MPVETRLAQWRVIGASTRGAAHLRLGLPNQDAYVCWAARGDSGSRVILAVSDGHGAAYHFRSDTGSRLAVDTAAAMLRENLTLPAGSRAIDSNPDALKALVQQIVASWRQAVATHLAKNPFTKEELESLAKGEHGQEALQRVETNPILAYGATLLAVLICDDAILYLQLGDGDILRVDASGKTTRPLPNDPHSVANETASLCLPDAALEFRTHIERSPDSAPVLILLSSDGYSNSFRSDQDFLQIGPDYLDILRQRGPESLEGELAEILAEASSKGSGDDVTLGLLVREPALNNANVAPELAEKTRSTLEREVVKLKAEQGAIKEKREREALRAEETIKAANRRANLSLVLMLVALAAVVAGALVVSGKLHFPAKPGSATSAPPSKPAATTTATTNGKSSDSPPSAHIWTLQFSGKGAPKPLALNSSTVLTAADLGLDGKSVGDGTIAETEVVGKELYFKNDSKKVWQYKKAGSKEEQPLDPSHEVKLSAGLVISFGTVSATVR